MRPRIYIPLLLLVALTIHLLFKLYSFLTIFFISHHTGILITQTQALQAHESQNPDTRTQYIPKKIHQVYHDWSGNNTAIPSDWDEVRKTCQDLNEGWEYTLWDAQSSRSFLEKEYPWFLTTYDSYIHPVQRVDSVRYFILRHYGGIYLDLDNGCKAPLEPLLYYPTWLTDGGRGALSNNVLATMPQHPFWIAMTEALVRYNYNYFFPYVTISYASGQWFETAVWDRYHHSLSSSKTGPKRTENGGSEGQGVSVDEWTGKIVDTATGESHDVPNGGVGYRLLMDDRPDFDTWVFFTQERGGTWVNWDNRMFLWIGDHLVLEAFVLLGLVAGVAWSVRRCVRRRGKGKGMGEGYRRLSGEIQMELAERGRGERYDYRV